MQNLKKYHMDVDLFDPWANAKEVKHEFGVDLISSTYKKKIRYYHFSSCTQRIFKTRHYQNKE